MNFSYFAGRLTRTSSPSDQGTIPEPSSSLVVLMIVRKYGNGFCKITYLHYLGSSWTFRGPLPVRAISKGKSQPQGDQPALGSAARPFLQLLSTTSVTWFTRSQTTFVSGPCHTCLSRRRSPHGMLAYAIFFNQFRKPLVYLIFMNSIPVLILY